MTKKQQREHRRMAADLSTRDLRDMFLIILKELSSRASYSYGKIRDLIDWRI